MDAMVGGVSGDGMCEDGGDGGDMMADDASHMPAVDNVTAAAIAAGLISVDHTIKHSLCTAINCYRGGKEDRRGMRRLKAHVS